jgi:hypothetical protein
MPEQRATSFFTRLSLRLLCLPIRKQEFILEAHQSLPCLHEMLLFLALTGILVPLLQRLRVNRVLALLAAGAAIGPFGSACGHKNFRG